MAIIVIVITSKPHNYRHPDRYTHTYTVAVAVHTVTVAVTVHLCQTLSHIHMHTDTCTGTVADIADTCTAANLYFPPVCTT